MRGSGEMTYIELRRNSFDIILQNKLHGHLILFRVGRHLRGFGIVTGNSGIRALRPVFDSGTITSWIGDSEQDRILADVGHRSRLLLGFLVAGAQV
jgi:hypothetical protein